jgi:hypothetical protein
MAKLYKFPSIEQFKNVVHNVRQYATKHGTGLPTLIFEGTIKLHGTNGGVLYDLETGELWCQSRERIITPYDDNAGFAAFIYAKKEDWIEQLSGIAFAEGIEDGVIAIFGEWAGPGIQKSVGISAIEQKHFFPFEVSLIRDDENRVNFDPSAYEFADFGFERVTAIKDFPSYTLAIDFNAPQNSQNQLVEITLAVEEQCPVAKSFGIEGIGEGVVWYNRETGLRFKVKGEKHSVSKVTTVKQIAAVDLERMASVKQFVDLVVTDNRLNQGIDKLREMGKEISVKSTGDFIKWVMSDVLKEEGDVIEASMLNKKELNPAMSEKAKQFFFSYINTEQALAA